MKKKAGSTRHKQAPTSATLQARGTQSRQLRIIGGQWRGRRWRFPDQPGIRPTPDRVRETLFNWVGGQVSGSRCLDLFAGSGALGLEALSRGASHVTFVERDGTTAREVRGRLLEWQAGDAEVLTLDALQYLGGRASPFDIVFLDPPFDSELLQPAMTLLEARGWLQPQALIYVESAARAELPPVPASWTLAKTKRAAAVGYHLLKRAAARGGGE